MSLIHRPCPTCASDQSTNFLTCKDHSVSKETFTIVQCSQCHMVYTNPVPDEASIGNYYQSQEYISHSDTKKGLVNRIYHLVRNHTLNQKAKLVKRINNNTTGNLLDIGCGTGYFLNKCKSEGWNVDGTEPDQNANALASQIVGKKIPQDLNYIQTNHTYHIISLWHVLEHIHSLNETLSKIKSILHKEGHLIIAVPNYESLDAKIYKDFWAAYDVPRHLYHFSKDSISRLIDKHDLVLQEIVPMTFDSYYVSLMSEKYKNPGNFLSNIANSIVNGYRSNNYQKNNYSSLIYIIRNK